MKVSLANLLLLINQKESEVSENYNNIMKNSAIIKDKELDGNETSLNEVEDFKYLQEKYEASAKDLELYKNKLAYINATEKISLNMTIIEAINKVSILRKRLELYNSLSGKKPSLERRFDGNGGSAYYRVNDLNFNLDEIKRIKEDIKVKISELEADIQNTNATTYVEI